mgnify:CR=1 FL=1
MKRELKRPDIMEFERAECNPYRNTKDDQKPNDEVNASTETSLRHYFYLEYRKPQ